VYKGGKYVKKDTNIGNEQGWGGRSLSLTKQMLLHIGIYCR
jgi:hypothetical protein